MPRGSLAPAATRLIAVLCVLGLAQAVIATLPRTLSSGGGWPIVADVAPSLAVLAAWVFSTASAARSADALWALPSDLFRVALGLGSLSVLFARAALFALRPGASTAGVRLATTIEDVLYGLGVVALGALAAFALARTVLRPALRERPAPASARDITLRTRFLVASTGAAFATAGVLLDLLVDFEHTSDATIAGYLITAAALVGFAATIGWLVGDDIARGIESVARRMRELAVPESARGPVPRFAADEIGDLAAAATELERRALREQSAAAAASERERIARELHDGVAKSVSVLALEAGALATHAPDGLRADLGRIERLARLLSDELRAIVTDLRARDGGEPFANLLHRTVARHRGALLEVDGDLDQIGTLARFEILRVAEEALRNAEQHAQACEIRTRVAVRDGRVRVEVDDDGGGITEVGWDTLADRGRFGLIGMRERAAILRGRFDITRSDRGGTLVVVDFPVTEVLDE